MRKGYAWLTAGAAAVGLYVGYVQLAGRHGPMFFHGESEERDEGRSPSEGDYWAIRVGYGGDAQHLRFEPAWLLDSARQDKAVASGVPAGKKTYRPSADKALALALTAIEQSDYRPGVQAIPRTFKQRILQD